MLNLYITRHGETQWNSENRLQGWKDSDLTDNGKRNAVALGERLSQIKFNAIYSSPIERAVKTTKLICFDRIIPIRFEDGLKEINLGDWEGKVKEEIEQHSKQEFFDFWNAPHLYNHEPHNGESLEALKSRVEHVINRIIADNKDGNVLIVTHGVTIRAILSYLMNIPTEKWWEGPFIEGTSLTLAQYDEGTFQVKMIGDTSHINMETRNAKK
ncbi:MAG: histidine phosphatase family protein [Bacillota bacterium]|nr:histidine phosphatase family protein [Bacillota bacterium]MDP4155937.1 histidine phosphatase family protein [Bacillota bacterium]